MLCRFGVRPNVAILNPGVYPEKSFNHAGLLLMKLSGRSEIKFPITGRDGLSLSETLVVMSVAALLMAYLIPALNRSRREAKAVVCQSSLHNWGLTFMTTENTIFDSRDKPRLGWWWVGAQRQYSDSNFAFICPMAKKLGPQISPVWWDGRKYRAWGYNWDIKDGNSDFVISSYGLNLGLTSSVNWKRHSFKNPSIVPVMFDCTRPGANLAGATRKPPEYDDMSMAGEKNDYGYEACTMCIDRHDGCIEMLFMDLSSRRVGLKELWKLKWTVQFDTAGPWTKAGGVKEEDWPKWMRGFKDY